MPISRPEELKKARILNGYSARAFAKKCGLNGATIANIEKHPKNVTPKTAKIICDTLGKDFEELFDIKLTAEKQA